MLPSRMPTKRSMGKSGTYNLVQKFKGYHAREDVTTIGQDILISPSRNVVIKTSGRVALVQGYSLDGASSSAADSGILSSYDFTNFKGDVRNMRTGFLTSAGNDGKLQYRYNNAWVTLKTALTNVRLSFCEFWDNTALVKQLLFVDGSNNIFSWNGAVTTLASATVNTVTKQGTNTWAQEGFSAAGGTLVLGGVVATYTGGTGTTTLTGVSVDFSNVGTYPVGSVVHQEVTTVALSAMTSISATFAPTVIGCGRRNQVYLGTGNSNLLYISQVNSYTNYAYTSPTRVVGEGALIPLDAPPTGFIAQESQAGTETYDLYISEGTSTWAVIRATLDSTNTKEALEHIRLKLSEKQGAQSARLMGKMKNHIMYVGNDNTACFLGYLSYKFVPTIVDFSYPIIDDMNSYDFTDGSIFYYRNYVYIAIPRHGVVRIYNMTDQTSEQFSGGKALEDVTQQPWFWEAPVTYPISGFYVVDGDLYGHSYTTSESYKLFDGGSFNGQEIDAVAAFGYEDGGDRAQSKGTNECYIEGYIKQNTQLSTTLNRDLGSFMTSQTKVIDGSDNTTVSYGGGGNSLGDSPLGVQTLGGNQTTVSTVTLPAWFHVIKTFLSKSYYLGQVVFSTKGIDLQWEIITYGTNTQLTTENNNSITQ